MNPSSLSWSTGQIVLTASRKLKTLTAEHRAKISAAHKGKKGHPNSPEHLKKLSERWSGPNNPKWNPDREALKLGRRLKGYCHELVRRTLEYRGRPKEKAAQELLGYTHQQLRAHIESLWTPGMSWENYGRKGWHIDHIRPLSSFPIDVDLAFANSLENLRPLWWRDNLSKGSRYDPGAEKT